MNKLFKFRVIIIILIFFVLFSLGLFQLYNNHFKYHIIAKFAESGPLYTNMPVYYKGYNIGQTKKVKPSKDYKYTLVKIVLSPKEPKLPENIVAKVKKADSRKDYIDLIMSEAPSDTLLENGSTIVGEAAFDLEAFLSDIADSGIIVPLLQTFSDTLLSAGKTSEEIHRFFSDSRLILKDNRQNLKQTTKDLAEASKSLKKISSRFNTSITENKLNNTTLNIDKSSTNILAATESIKNITASVDCATRNLDKTMSKLDCTLSEANSVLSNVKAITNGLCETLGKRFAGLRIIFGKPMDKNKCPKNCSK